MNKFASQRRNVARQRNGNLRRLLWTTASASATLIALHGTAQAQGAEGAGGADEIIVTARRADERLQDVPVSVQVLTGDNLQKLAITKADELSKLAPGLTLVNQGNNTQVALRGVTWRPGSGTPATPIYFNEVPFDPQNSVQSLFDIGQIEVLRGPQGTSRGAPSISGAVTLTTRKPNLSEFGGYVQAQYGSGDHWDLQAAINAPIIQDVLALRLATNIENSRGDRIDSVNSSIKPHFRDRSYRATALFTPTDTVTVEAMYQRRKTNIARYDQVVGTGSPGAAASPIAALGGLGAIPANFNGPELTLSQRASIGDEPQHTARQHVDFLTVNASWEVLGQKLTYNFGRQFSWNTNSDTRDPQNMLPGYEPLAVVSNGRLPSWRTHEIRLSSMPDPDRPFDYDIGWFSKRSGGPISQSLPNFLPGAFGAPNALPGSLTSPNSAYMLPVSVNIDLGQVFDSFYGDIRFHIDQNTELSGGLAIIRDRVPTSLETTVGAGMANAGPLEVIKLGFPAALRPALTSCEAADAFARKGLVTSTVYPGTCDVNVPAGTGAPAPQSSNPVYSKALYHFSLSHNFSDSVMAYATTGSSYRSGLPALGSVGLPPELFVPKPETAKSYEVGVKTSWGRSLNVNVAAFQIDYANQLTQFQNVKYYNSVTGKTDLTSLAFYQNVDSRVRGFELEVAARPLENLTLGANASYSKIKAKGGLVPANPGDCADAVDVSAGSPINFCSLASGSVLNQDAPFSATVNGNYTVPLGSLEGYFRFNLSYKGKNPNYGNFATAGVFKSVPSYAVLDLFAGVAGESGIWNVGFYGKNVTNKQVELSRVTPPNSVYSPYAVAPGGYDVVRMSSPREIGVTLLYALGSR